MATIHDVAERAGVSVTTVSRVLNNRGYISESTRSKVYQCMEELGYQPNEIARSLLKKQSNIIGLIVPNVSHPFFGELASFVEYYAYEHGFKMLLCNSHLDPVKEKEYIEMMRRNRVDGIIMGSHTLEVEDYRNLHHPIVTFDRQIDSEIPYMSSDNYRGGELATELLVKKDCKKIAHICGNLELDLLANQRTQAFQDVVSRHEVEHLIVQTDMNVFDQQQYERIIAELFREHPDIDGVFATSDIIAAYVVQHCYKLGKRVPHDIRIVGYDDVSAASWVVPSITTIQQPIEEMSKQAIELIRGQLAEETIRMANILPVTLIERGTT
ncbi:LacI family DNA-binding transcriptional regulator [Paenibacillus sedimenti]|uniref:LacI family DNA-binding transcriptional regulator n=1 Tax=Paenibacillus sedimenti TaxID=2770274 RepID=A0A926QK59_9BACL|nr:LacI family DNA-binding transcriptional regulator [Paenibacillus sedimenti]MBD0382466.1 LacI family DNA-binding transcriptional regulator [Paenibacillus sedimenti]